MKKVSLLLIPLLIGFVAGCNSKRGSTTLSTTSDDVTTQSGTSATSGATTSGTSATSSQPSSSTATSSSEQVPPVTQPIVTSMVLTNSRSNSSNLLNVNDNADFTITIANPDEVSISSISINNQAINTYLVNTNSGTTTLMCEITGSSVAGEYEYRLTSVRYIDNETVKDAAFISTISVTVTYQVPIVPVVFWTGFGSTYSNYVQTMCDSEFDAKSIRVNNQSRGSYENIHNAIVAAASTHDLPQFANGYSEHFAHYSSLNIVEPLDNYITAYNTKNSVNLLNDIYEQYMVENSTIAYDANENALITGLPFNRAAEVLVYNGYFVDYAIYRGVIASIPKSWQEWSFFGPGLRNLQYDMIGKYLHGTVNEDGTATNFVLNEDSSGNDILLDMHEVNAYQSALMSCDSPDNLFITLVKQWGEEFVSYTKANALSVKHGYLQFNNTRVLGALELINSLYGNPLYPAQRVFATPNYIAGGGYSSSAFKSNVVMFVICSSGSLSYSAMPGTRVAAIPYYDDGVDVHKYYVSQGTNFGLFDVGDASTKSDGFEAMADFATGGIQAAWAANSGYFPVSRSAANHATYQNFLNTPGDTAITELARSAALVNQNVYLNNEQNWVAYTDPAFYGIGEIRNGVYNLISQILADVGEGKDNTKTIQQYLDDVYYSLSKYVLP